MSVSLPEDFDGRVIGPKGIGYASAVRQLSPGEELYAVHDQLIRSVAVPLPDEAAWRRTDEQYGEGLSLDYVFAAGPAPVAMVVVITDEEEQR